MTMKRSVNNQNLKGIAGGGWQVVYTGFVLILLSFFIMLSSFATLEKAKVLQFVKAFTSAVRILPEGDTFSEGSPGVPAKSDGRRFENEMRHIHATLTQWIATHAIGENIDLVLSDEGLMIRFDDSLLFDVGSAALSMKTLPLLDKIGQTIEHTDYPVRIEGHTDNVPIRTRRYPSNWELSTARAVNVLRYFIKARNIPAHQLTAVGCGPFQALTTNDSWQNRAKNRRVEIIFHGGE